MNDDARKQVAKTLRTAAAALVKGMAFDVDNPAQRAELAEKLQQKLGAIGFKPSTRRTRDKGRSYGKERWQGQELVLTFQHRKDPGLVINVFTSITKGKETVRGKGADAIRICTEYETKALREGKEEGAFSTGKLVFQRPLNPKEEVSQCTIHRRANSVDDIVERVVNRARMAYKALNIVKRCGKCQAPVALSKAGKEYCSETCWKSGKTSGSVTEDGSGEFNKKLAGLLKRLKRDIGATKIRQGYKGTGGRSHRRQIWIDQPDIDRGIDIWLEDSQIKLGGILYTGAGQIPYGDDSPEDVYKKLVSWFKLFIDAKRRKASASASVLSSSLEIEWEGEGRVGDSRHLTRRERGTIPTAEAMKLRGKKGEEKYLHWRTENGEKLFGRYPEARWEAFVADIKKRGIQDPILVVKDHGKEPLIYEGNHRVRAADQAGQREVPVEIRYFGHAEQDALVAPKTKRDKA